MTSNVSVLQAKAWEKKQQRRGLEILQHVLTNLCKSHPREGTDLLRHVKRGDWESALSWADFTSKQKYSDARSHFVANQLASMIKKYPFPKGSIPIDPEKKAREVFDECERKCARMNRYFGSLLSGKPVKRCVSEIDLRIQGFIQYVIGTAPDLQTIFNHCRLGPGANIGVNGNATNFARKILASWSVTPGALIYAHHAIGHHYQFREHVVKRLSSDSSSPVDYPSAFSSFRERCTIVRHNKVTFVPKTAKVHRTIAVEPLLNGFVQLGVDEYLKRRLKRIGIDLSDQTINAEMARKGSLDVSADSFVTIDLASASDSIARETVRYYLPPDWFDFLNSIRSTEYLLDKVVKPYEKFCSMGNGFCFPLETLLFVGACHAVGAGRPGIDYHVYGDDIVVRKRFAPLVIHILSRMGFTTNTEKTFLKGPFRESCGKDWFEGVDVRPYTLKTDLTKLPDVFKFLNLSTKKPYGFFDGLRSVILDRIPTQLRLLRPYPGEADTGIDPISDEWMGSGNVIYDRKRRRYRWTELHSVPKCDHIMVAALGLHGDVHMYGALLGSASEQPVTLRRETRTRMRVVSHPGATSQWLPPW